MNFNISKKDINIILLTFFILITTWSCDRFIISDLFFGYFSFSLIRLFWTIIMVIYLYKSKILHIFKFEKLKLGYGFVCLSFNYCIMYAPFVIMLFESGITLEISTFLIISIISIINAMIVASFEECLFRAIWIPQIGEHKNVTLKAIILAGLLFGLLHAVPNLIYLTAYPVNVLLSIVTQVFRSGTVGVIFCLLYYKTHNLLTTIILHMVADIPGFWIELYYKYIYNNYQLIHYPGYSISSELNSTRIVSQLGIATIILFINILIINKMIKSSISSISDMTAEQ